MLVRSAAKYLALGQILGVTTLTHVIRPPNPGGIRGVPITGLRAAIIIRWCHRIATELRGRGVEEFALAQQDAFKGVGQIVGEMPAIGDMLDCGCAFGNGFGIAATAIAGDRGNGRMLLHPGHDGRGLAIRQNIDDSMAFKVHNNRAVPQAFPPCPVVLSTAVYN